MRKKYRIFDYTWHIPHQYDMLYALKDDCEFYYCLNLKSDWDLTKRPKPDNLNFVTHYEPATYDVAILHLDQSSIWPNQKRTIYQQFDELIKDIPKIVLNHGTPVFPEAYPSHNLSFQEMEQRCIDNIKALVGDNIMVVNSHTAASEKEWGFGLRIIIEIAWFPCPRF